jgi:secreted effector protein SseB
MNMSVNTEQTTGTGYVNSDAPTDIRYGCALKETSMVGNAMVTMADMMLMFSQLANDKFVQMSKKMDVARDVQDMANRLEIIMSKLEKDSDTAELPADIIQYMRENNILVGDKTIDELLFGNLSEKDQAYIKDLQRQIAKIDNGEYADRPQHVQDQVKADLQRMINNRLDQAPAKVSKKDMESIKVALESAGGKASDFVQQSQLKLQQLMQNFNTAVTMANSIQSMNAESTKSIAQSIR